MQILSAPDPDYADDRKVDHLWILVGGSADYQDGATAYYLGSDRDIEGDDLASRVLKRVIEEHGIDSEEAIESLSNYRTKDY